MTLGLVRMVASTVTALVAVYWRTKAPPRLYLDFTFSAPSQFVSLNLCLPKMGDKGGYRQINKALNICAFEDYLNGQIASLPSLPNVEQVTSRVLRVLGQNPGKFTFQGTNTFVIGTGRSRILVDTSGGEPEYASLLASTLAKRGITIQYVVRQEFMQTVNVADDY